MADAAPPADEEVAAEEHDKDFTETTTQSYGSKMKDACTGMCMGFLLFFGSIGLLIFNEGRTVKRARDLDEGRKNFVELDLSNFTGMDLPTSYDNKLIHTFGDLSTTAILTDPLFGVSSETSNDVVLNSTVTNNTTSTNSINATTFSSNSETVPPSLLKLDRSVAMFQWKETSTSKTYNQADGSTRTETTYSYSKDWSSSYIDSSQFREASANKTNPPFPFEDMFMTADPILMEDRLLLLESLVDYLYWFEPLTVTLDNVPDVTLKSRLVKETSNSFFYKATSNTSIPSAPLVGDARIVFSAITARDSSISVIAKLNAKNDEGKNSLDTYTTEGGRELLLVEQGMKTAAEMFTGADAENTTLAWILRFIGLLLMVISILLLLQPLATAVDIIPVIGDCMKGGMEGCIIPLIAFLIALPISLFVIALSWFAYRPFIALPICLVSLAALIWLKTRHKKNSASNNNNDDPPIVNDGKSNESNNNNSIEPSPFNSNYDDNNSDIDAANNNNSQSDNDQINNNNQNNNNNNNQNNQNNCNNQYSNNNNQFNNNNQNNDHSNSQSFGQYNNGKFNNNNNGGQFNNNNNSGQFNNNHNNGQFNNNNNNGQYNDNNNNGGQFNNNNNSGQFNNNNNNGQSNNGKFNNNNNNGQYNDNNNNGQVNNNNNNVQYNTNGNNNNFNNGQNNNYGQDDNNHNNEQYNTNNNHSNNGQNNYNSNNNGQNNQNNNFSNASAPPGDQRFASALDNPPPTAPSYHDN